jgi:hypothetical protein
MCVKCEACSCCVTKTSINSVASVNERQMQNDMLHPSFASYLEHDLLLKSYWFIGYCFRNLAFVWKPTRALTSSFAQSFVKGSGFCSLSCLVAAKEPDDFQKYLKQWKFVWICNLLLQNEWMLNAILFHVHFIMSLFISFWTAHRWNVTQHCIRTLPIFLWGYSVLAWQCFLVSLKFAFEFLSWGHRRSVV